MNVYTFMSRTRMGFVSTAGGTLEFGHLGMS